MTLEHRGVFHVRVEFPRIVLGSKPNGALKNTLVMEGVAALEDPVVRYDVNGDVNVNVNIIPRLSWPLLASLTLPYPFVLIGPITFRSD